MQAEPSPDMRRVLERLAVEDAGLADPTTLPPGEGRAAAARGNRRWNLDLPEMAHTDDFPMSDTIPARILVPQVDDGTGAILYVHGGGFAFCDRTTHERAARMLAIAARAPVVTFDYRLAPEHPFPAGLDDTVAAWRVFRAVMDGRFLAVAGDSAGANLALATMLREEARGPAAALLFYGVFGADFDTPSYTTFADGPGLTRGKMQRYLDWYAPPERRRDPLVAPLEASDAALAALPPLYLNAAGIDPLRSDTERLVERLRAIGRSDPFDVFEGVVHGFMQMTEVLPEARLATERAGEAFREMTRTRTAQGETQ